MGKIFKIMEIELLIYRSIRVPKMKKAPKKKARSIKITLSYQKHPKIRNNKLVTIHRQSTRLPRQRIPNKPEKTFRAIKTKNQKRNPIFRLPI